MDFKIVTEEKWQECLNTHSDILWNNKEQMVLSKEFKGYITAAIYHAEKVIGYDIVPPDVMLNGSYNTDGSTGHIFLISKEYLILRLLTI